ncbi:MAG: hypothetical protein KDE31_38135 [Caldilineaceae bacterium]|nr:hypothetical protein [Caldilineaceae bacterium]
MNVSLDVGGQITGRVSVWGQPAPNAQLYLHKAENGGWFPVSYTSVDPFTGSYAFRGLPAGRYRVQASAFILYPPISTYYLYGMYGGDNWGTATDIKLAAAETRSDIDIAMSQGPHFDGAISGKVTANGKPLANVQVGLYNPYGCCYPFVIGPPQTYAVTDADGRYRIEGLTLSGFLVRFRDLSGIHASLYYPNQPTVDYGQTVIISDTATTTDIDIDLPIGGSIQGQLYQADGKALKGIPVIAALETSSYPNVIYDETVTGDDGSYQLTGLYPGTYYICAGAYEVFIYGNGQRECYGECDVPWYNDWGQAITVQASSAIENIDILWGPDHYIRLPIIAR